MLYLKMFNVPLILGCMDESVSDGGMVNSGYMSTRLGLKGSPTEAEVLTAARNLILAKYTGSRIHLSPLTTRDSIHMVRDYKKRDVRVTSGTCPHYFTLSENYLENYNTFAKVDPPLRTEEDIISVLYGLNDGTIDVISSGHTPAAYDRKNTEFENAAYGISSLETALMVTFTALVKTKHSDMSFTPLDIVKKMSENPAKILGLETKGIIKEGMDADLIIVDDKNKFVVDASKFHSKAKYSPYDGKEFYGKCVGMICGGRVLKRPTDEI
jgi:dihydroorotase